MDGFRSVFYKDENLLYRFMQLATKEQPSIKIDGKPALVFWSDFAGLEGPGVGFKSLIGQLRKGTVKDYFTDENSISEYLASKPLDPFEKSHREKAFIKTLRNLSKLVVPGYMLWGDVLFVDETEFQNYECQPNTVLYRFDPEVFDCAGKAFGICIHTVVDENFATKDVWNVEDFLTTTPKYTFILSPSSIKCEADVKSLQEARQAIEQVHQFCKTFKILPEVGKSISYFYKKGVYDLEQIAIRAKTDVQTIQDTLDALTLYEESNNLIVDAYKTQGITTSINGQITAGEGLVYVLDGQAMKFVKDEFTEANKAHMKGIA